MNLEHVILAGIWDFPADAPFLMQVGNSALALVLWTMFGYFGLQCLLLYYEAGKGQAEARTVERKEADIGPLPSGKRYRFIFSLRLGLTAGLLLEGCRLLNVTGLGLLYWALAFVAWKAFSPDRKWTQPK